MKSIKKLEKWFFSFWVIRYKVTYLLAFVIFVFWILSVINLPKESDPEVNLPIVSVTTRYDWVSAAIIDADITEKLEESLEDIEGLTSINSSSSEWNSNITIEIADGYNVDSVISEIEDAVDGVNLPSWVDSDYPKVNQRDFTSTDMFSTILYAKIEDFSFENLLDISEVLKQNTQWKNGIKDVTIDTNTVYDIRVILSKQKLDIMWLSIDRIGNSINNNSSDSPIGTYEIQGVDYSFKLSWKLKEYSEILDIDLLVGDSFIKLSDVAEVDLYYGEEKINKFWKFNDTGYTYISLTYSKLAWSNIFDVAPEAKSSIELELEKSLYNGITMYYTNDTSQEITDDFNDLYASATTTLLLVFVALIFFVGFRESVIATFILPLAFLLAFIVVEYMWETLNQMTTFAFVLAFWIAIDTIIIIVEGAAEKVKQWYQARTATLISLREFKSPIIIGTITTISAFIPILTLPGIMGIFLAYIPLVVFITLLSTLFVSLTIAGAIFVGLSKKKKYYEVFPEREKVMNNAEKELLLEERKWKTELIDSQKNIREKIFDIYSWSYKQFITKILQTRKKRWIAIVTPFLLLILASTLLLPNIWFEIFPSSRTDSLRMTIKGPQTHTPSDMQDAITYIETNFSQTKEILDYTLSISSNQITASLNLTPAIERQNKEERMNDVLQKDLTDLMKLELWAQWYTIGSKWGHRWPGGWDPVGIFLTTKNADNYNAIISIADDFEKYLLQNNFVSEVNISASDSLWEIEFSVNKKQAALLGLTEKEIFNAVSIAVRGKILGSIKWASNDHDIKLYFDSFLDEVTPSSIENINIYIWWQTIKAWNVIDYKITKTSPKIKRWDWDIQVQVSATLTDSSQTTSVQTSLQEYAKKYDFPKGVTYKNGWENEENADLINSVITGVFVAFFLIFSVLVYQFNSYGQPAVILYSVFMSLIWVIVWLYVTGNPISMPVGVWFISLMWIVVNDAIIMIDKINKNLWNKMEFTSAIIEWAVSRLNPILVTTITTAAGILPIAMQDPFWAWLGYTIAFWLATGSFMTLFAIPTLYYVLEKRKYK